MVNWLFAATLPAWAQIVLFIFLLAAIFVGIPCLGLTNKYVYVVEIIGLGIFNLVAYFIWGNQVSHLNLSVAYGIFHCIMTVLVVLRFIASASDPFQDRFEFLYAFGEIFMRNVGTLFGSLYAFGALVGGIIFLVLFFSPLTWLCWVLPAIDIVWGIIAIWLAPTEVEFSF